MTNSRVSSLQTHIRGAIERGVRIYVLTRPVTERTRPEQQDYELIEKSLVAWGVRLLHKRSMHEKIVLIDGEVIWTGSLNPLSHRDTKEIMERRKSPRLVEEYEKSLRWEEIISVYDGGDGLCPVCKAELVTAEGMNGPYLRCVNDTYKRSLDAAAPQHGLIVCARCNQKVEFGKWGGQPVWRCTVEHRHHQQIRPGDLQLPGMAKLIPKGELSALKRLWNIG